MAVAPTTKQILCVISRTFWRGWIYKMGLPRCCCCAWLALAHPPPLWKWAFRCNRPWLPRSSSTSCAEFERSEVPRDRSLATNGCLTGLAFWGDICCGCGCCCCSGWAHRGIPPGVPNCPAVRFAIPAAGLWIWSPDRSYVSRVWGNGCLPCSCHRHPGVAQMRLQGY